MKKNVKKPGPVIINNPPAKFWWKGDERVEEFMLPVAKAIQQYHNWPSEEFTAIYNKAYEAVYAAIKKYGDKENE